MVNPASLATDVTSIGLLTVGKGAVESRGVVTRDPSKMGRIGWALPAAASRENALLTRLTCALKMVFRDKAFWQEMSVEPQQICPVKLACRVA